jgi:hypothetical protein
LPNIYLENHLEYCGFDTSHPGIMAWLREELCRLLDTALTDFHDTIAAAPVLALRPIQVA